MRFDKVDIDAEYAFTVNKEAFRDFLSGFHIAGVHWDEPTSIHPAYFLRLLEEGDEARERPVQEGFTNVLYQEYYDKLLDHCALWKTYSGAVFCTAMPYGRWESVAGAFVDMKRRFGYGESVRMVTLGNRYRYRSNGDWMIAIYGNRGKELFEK